MTYRFGACTPAFTPPAPLVCRGGSVCAWLGGDGAFGTMLDATRSAWTFGDSYYGPAGSRQRHVGQVIANVIGLGTCRNGAWSVSYHCGGTAAKPSPFFDDATNAAGDTRFAAQKVFNYASKLYVFLARIGNEGATFHALSSLVARVNDPAGDPGSWAYDLLALSASGWDGGGVGFGSEAVALPPDLLLFGGTRGGEVYPCKLPLAALASCPAGGDLSGALSYRTASGWSPGLPGTDAADAGFTTTSGFSVRYDSAMARWIAVWADTTGPEKFPAYASVATGPTPWGPWGEARRVYHPHMAPGNALYHPDNAVYAPHEATDFEAEPGKGPLRLVYSVGSRSALTGGDQTRQLAGLDGYVPGVASVPNPFA